MGPIRLNLIAVLLLSSQAIAADPLSLAEQHRLGAYLAYIVSGVKEGVIDEVLKAGMTCPNCGGRGATGDGVICSTCDWVSPDGLLACKGTGKLQATGDNANDEALCETFEDEMTAFSEALTEEQIEPDILCLKGNAWTFEDKRIREATNSEMVKHLVEVHGLEYESVSKYSRDELIAQHNLLHNSEVRSSAPSASCPDGSCPTSSSGSSCPSGNCPTSSSSSSSSRRGLFGRRR